MIRSGVIDEWVLDHAVQLGATPINFLVTKLDIPANGVTSDGKCVLNYSDYGYLRNLIT